MKHTLKRIMFVLVAVLALFWVAASQLLPGVIRSQVQHLETQIGARIAIGAIQIEPLMLRARLNDVALMPLNGNADDALLTLKQLEVDARFWPLLTGRVSLERIVLDQPQAGLVRSADRGRQAGVWNWLVFVDRLKALGDQSPPADPAQQSAIKVSVDEFVLKDARVMVRDPRQKSAYDLGPFNLHLTDLRNQDDAGHVGGSSVQSHYTFNLGRVQIPLPGQAGMPDRLLRFENVVASGQFEGDSGSNLRAALDLKLDEGSIQSTWQVDAKGALSGKMALQSLPVKPLLSLVPTYQPLDSLSGVIDGEVEIRQDAAAINLGANIKFNALDVRIAGSRDPLIAWDTTALNRLRLELPAVASQSGQLNLDEVVVENPKIRFGIDAQGYSNFRALFNRPEPGPVTTTAGDGTVTAPPAPEANTIAGADKTPAFRYDIRSVRLKNGSMFFADESINPVFRVNVTDLNGSVQGISNAPGRYATMVLNGRAAKTGSLRARGQLAFADPRLNHDVSLVFRNIPLNATNPYVMTFAGYVIDDGRIDVDLRYVTKDAQLQGKNRFVIRKIRLGEPVANYEGARLPLGLAIALLEDSDGMIDVNIPVRGNVNEPEFSVGHLVWQAVKTLLNNVVTAPFRALGALLGIENMDALAFVPGESALPLEGEEPLNRIADYLVKHPNTRLIIHGPYDQAVDAPELARALADTAILQASGIKVVAGEPLPLPNLTDPQVRTGLKSAYASQVGRLKLGQRLLSLPDSPERDAQMRQELIESYKVGENQLRALATQRAQAVRARLLGVDSELTARVRIGDVESVSADKAGVPVKVVLEKND